MAKPFGEVADLYNDARPGYPAELADAIAAYAGPVSSAVEIGAGTGKGTEVLARLGVALTCVEPDPRMAAVLAANHPHATVVVSTFEAWSPSPGGVPLLACALAWHWLDPGSRNRLAHEALAPGGVLAVFAHRYAFTNPAHHLAVVEVTRDEIRDRGENWIEEDIVASGLWTDVHTARFVRTIELTTAQYLALQRTFSPHLRHSVQERHRIQTELAQRFDALGGIVPLELDTRLTLARKGLEHDPAGAREQAGSDH